MKLVGVQNMLLAVIVIGPVLVFIASVWANPGVSLWSHAQPAVFILVYAIFALGLTWIIDLLWTGIRAKQFRE